MSDWLRTSGSCCSEQLIEQTSTYNEGERVRVYAECRNCGATWRDVFRYSYSEVDTSTVGGE